MRALRELFAKWEGYLDDTGRYRKGGVETSRRHSVRVAVREFCDMFGNVPIAKYPEQFLLQYRDELEKRMSLSRGGINRKVGILRAALKWAFGRGKITRDQWLGTTAVEPLTRELRIAPLRAAPQHLRMDESSVLQSR